MQKLTFILTIIQMVAVPLIAFLIRMASGDARNENEQIISEAIRAMIRRYNTVRGEKT